MTKREPFARVLVDGRIKTTQQKNMVVKGTYLDIGGVYYVYGQELNLGYEAEKINASFEKAVAERVKEAVALAQYECGCAKCVNPPGVK